jgi:hypothetical protein
MEKIKVPMRLKVSKHSLGYPITNPFSSEIGINIELQPMPISASFNCEENSTISEEGYIQKTFERYLRPQLINSQNLYAIRDLLTSAKVDNAFDMLTLTKQLVPMLDEAIAQADPDNYKLEIIR